MNLIKNCPACGRKLRFPIDRGKIRVRCACGESFIADPDDTALYKDAHFDLAPNGTANPGVFQALRKKLSEVNAHRPLESLIGRAYKLRYTIQNYPLLPASRQRRIVFAAIAAAIAFAAVIYLVYALSSRRIPPQGLII